MSASNPGPDDGATPRELVLEACRRNNTDLLHDVLRNTPPLAPADPAPPAADTQTPTEAAIAALLNSVRDSIGNAALHVAAAAGALETLDVLLDQPGVETDPRCRLHGETPLHKAVRFVNGLGEEAGPGAEARDAAWAEARPVVEILVDAGCDPRIRSRGKVRALELVDPRNAELRDFLRRAEMVVQEGEGVVDEEEEEGGDGPPSDSD